MLLLPWVDCASIIVVDDAAGRAEMEKAKKPARLVLVLVDAEDRKKDESIVVSSDDRLKMGYWVNVILLTTS